MAIPAPFGMSVDTYRQDLGFTRKSGHRSFRSAIFRRATSLINHAAIYLLPAAAASAIQTWLVSTGHFRPGILIKHMRDDDFDNVPFRWIRAAEVEAVHVRRVRAIVAPVLVAATLALDTLVGGLVAHPSVRALSAACQDALCKPGRTNSQAIASARSIRLAAAGRPTKVEVTGSIERSVLAEPGLSSAIPRHPQSTMASHRQYTHATLVPKVLRGLSKYSPELPATSLLAPRQALPNESNLPPAKKLAEPGFSIATPRHRHLAMASHIADSHATPVPKVLTRLSEYSPQPSGTHLLAPSQEPPRKSSQLLAKNYEALRDFALSQLGVR
jgi:hypothetical protein